MRLLRLSGVAPMVRDGVRFGGVGERASFFPLALGVRAPWRSSGVDPGKSSKNLGLLFTYYFGDTYRRRPS